MQTTKLITANATVTIRVEERAPPHPPPPPPPAPPRSSRPRNPLQPQQTVSVSEIKVEEEHEHEHEQRASPPRRPQSSSQGTPRIPQSSSQGSPQNVCCSLNCSVREIFERVSIFISFVGAIITIYWTQKTTTMKRVPIGVFYGWASVVIVLNFTVLVFLPCLRRCLLFRKQWGDALKGFLSLITLLLSAIPTLISGVDETSLFPMIGLPIWSLALEFSIKSPTNLGLLNLTLGISVSVGATQILATKSHINHFANFIFIGQPIMYTILYYFLLPSKSSLAIPLPTKPTKEVLDQYNLKLTMLTTQESKFNIKDGNVSNLLRCVDSKGLSKTSPYYRFEVDKPENWNEDDQNVFMLEEVKPLSLRVKAIGEQARKVRENPPSTVSRMVYRQ